MRPLCSVDLYKNETETRKLLTTEPFIKQKLTFTIYNYYIPKGQLPCLSDYVEKRQELFSYCSLY